MLATLDPNPDRAAALLDRLTLQRGMTTHPQLDRTHHPQRRRCAMLDTGPNIVISNTLLKQEFDRSYGPQSFYAQANRDRLTNQSHRPGPPSPSLVESFSDLAVAHSLDSSKAQGGLIGPINGQDPTYPEAIRAALIAMKPSQVSDPIALDSSYAILRAGAENRCLRTCSSTMLIDVLTATRLGCGSKPCR